jgi:AraC-like DNA-binding protein
MATAPSSALLNQTSNAAKATLLSTHRWPGVERLAYEVQWGSKPGSVSWTFARPALCYLRGEIGGRGELRQHANMPCEGEYHGIGHLSFLSAQTQATLFSESLREAQYWCFLLYPEQADALTPGQSHSIAQASSRFMFRNERVQFCLDLLCDCDDSNDSYSNALSRALLASLLDVVSQNPIPPKHRLSGLRLHRVLSHISCNLDASLMNEDLARIAEAPASEFGKMFRETTGISPQRWQMDARVRRAQGMLVDDPKISLATVASIAGFSDQSHFTRAFLDVIGMTPTTWLHQRN